MFIQRSGAITMELVSWSRVAVIEARGQFGNEEEGNVFRSKLESRYRATANENMTVDISACVFACVIVKYRV